MKKQFLNEEGFTLLECLLVLLLVSIILLVTSVTMLPLSDQRKVEQFVEQFRQDVAFMQQAAISGSSRYSMRMYVDSHRYVITTPSSNTAVLTRSYDPNIAVSLYTMPNPLIYGQDGNINKAGTMHVRYKNLTYYIVFQLGRGRMYYYEKK